MVIIMEFKIGGDAKQLDSDMVYTVFGKLIRKGKPMIKLAYRKDIWLLPLSIDNNGNEYVEFKNCLGGISKVVPAY